jgi:hypothetical protein
MFNFIASSIQAYNQIGMFIGALVCLGFGALILGNSLYWRMHALRASGTIIGVSDEKNMYTPVYRYTLRDGQTYEAKSDTSSSSVGGKETGRVVPLLISAHNPTEAREANNYLLDIVGIFFNASGLWLGYTALTTYPVTPMTWIVAAAMLVYLAERGHHIFIPKEQRLSIEEWKRQHQLDGTSAIDLTKVKPIEDILSTPDVQKTQQTQRQQYKIAAPFLALFAIILFCVGIYQSITITRLESVGLRSQGEVVRLKEEYSSGSGGGHYSYYAIVRYRTEKNVNVEFKDNVGSNPPGHRPGDKVTVLYLADNPLKEAIIDRGIWWNWAIPAIIFLSSLFLVWILVAMLRSVKARETESLAACSRA